MILRPVSELPFFTRLAVMADGAGCVGQCSKLREKGENMLSPSLRVANSDGQEFQAIRVIKVQSSKFQAIAIAISHRQ